MSDTLGTRLRLLRNERGLRQQDVADVVGISRNYLSELEGDKVLPSADVLSKLAMSFKVSLDELYRGITPVEQDAEFVEDAEERAVLAIWRVLDHSQKQFVLSGMVGIAYKTRDT